VPLDAIAGAKGDVAALSAKINEPGRAGKYAEAYPNDASSPRNAYPAFWGPFALIGEGLRVEIFLIVQCSIFIGSRQRRMVAQPRRQTK